MLIVTTTYYILTTPLLLHDTFYSCYLLISPSTFGCADADADAGGASARCWRYNGAVGQYQGIMGPNGTGTNLVPLGKKAAESHCCDENFF